MALMCHPCHCLYSSLSIFGSLHGGACGQRGRHALAVFQQRFGSSFWTAASCKSLSYKDLCSWSCGLLLQALLPDSSPASTSWGSSIFHL